MGGLRWWRSLKLILRRDAPQDDHPIGWSPHPRYFSAKSAQASENKEDKGLGNAKERDKSA
jgi:hypothetical protein